MIKIALVLIGVLFLIDDSAPLKCYICPDGCEAGKAMEKPCGANIGPTQTGVCSRQLKKGSNKPEFALRKCVVYTKGAQPPCPDDYTCSECDSDLCNATPKISTNSCLLVVAIATFAFAHKFLL